MPTVRDWLKKRGNSRVLDFLRQRLEVRIGRRDFQVQLAKDGFVVVNNPGSPSDIPDGQAVDFPANRGLVEDQRIFCLGKSHVRQIDSIFCDIELYRQISFAALTTEDIWPLA